MPELDAAYLAAARAYCLARFHYDSAYEPGGRERQIAADAESTAREPWLRAVVDAVEVRRLLAEREQVRKTHRPSFWAPPLATCKQSGHPWPCVTARLVYSPAEIQTTIDRACESV
jgi:hypothetical protein